MINMIELMHLIKKRQVDKPYMIQPFGSAIKYKRKELGLTLEEASEDICSISYLSKVENNRDDDAMTQVDMPSLVENLVEDAKWLNQIKLHKINTNISHGISVFGIETELKSACANLISNAIKFTPKRGTVRVATQKHGNKLHITVSDSGMGMTPETLKTLQEFNNQHSTKGTSGEVGSGVGLQLCYEFVHQHGGTLTFNSQPGQGTCATVQLPCI